MLKFHPVAARNHAFGRSSPLARPSASPLAAAGLGILLSVCGVQPIFAHEFKVGSLEIEHPWTRETPAGAKVAGGYFVVTNQGSTPDRLVSITSQVSEKAEIHEMAVKDGVMTMRPVDGGVEIPGGAKVELKPGGYHVMFMGLKEMPKLGEEFEATLTFEKAGPVKVEFAVQAMDSTGAEESGD